MSQTTGKSAVTFLETATPDQLLRAAAANHRAWMRRAARAVGGSARRDDGLLWIYRAEGDSDVTIPFPRLSARRAGDQLDAALQRCRAIEALREVSCWTLREQTSPPDLGVRLAARGFEWGWRPHWMALDLRRMDAAPPLPAGMSVELVQDLAIWDAPDLPYYDHAAARRLHGMARARPRRVWHFAAWSDGQPIGQSVLHLTTGRYGVAGIFNVGIVPDARGRGIGKAVTSAALHFARDLGCQYALLNATEMGEPLYRALGFTSLGYGQTWWLHHDVLRREPPAPREVAFAEAVGRGDLVALVALADQLPPAWLDAQLQCGLTPVELAVKTAQPAAVEWLAGYGATLDVVSAWDLGWQERAAELLATTPALANHTSGRWRITPLHTAVLRDDLELARVLLSAKPDLEIADAEFHSTPLGWARHFGRDEIVRMIEQTLVE